MWRIINFLTGFIIGVVLGASAIMLTTPESGQEVKNIFQQEFRASKTKLEDRFFRNNDSPQTNS